MLPRPTMPRRTFFMERGKARVGPSEKSAARLFGKRRSPANHADERGFGIRGKPRNTRNTRKEARWMPGGTDVCRENSGIRLFVCFVYFVVRLLSRSLLQRLDERQQIGH